MKTITSIFALTGLLAAVTAIAFPQVPICIFDPVKGEYVCPTTKSSHASADTSTENDATLIDAIAAKCGEEDLQKCTRERQGSVCKNGVWELVHRCATGQQCDMKEGNFCCRTRGPGFSC